MDETFSNLTWRLFSILSSYDYRWVKIAYGLGKIVLMPRTWSVRIFTKKTACLVTLIVTLRIWVETYPGFWRKLFTVCQADLDLKYWFVIHENNWPKSESKVRFLKIKMLFLQKHNFWLTFLSNISIKTERMFWIKGTLTNCGKFPSNTMSWICFYSNSISKCHN